MPYEITTIPYEIEQTEEIFLGICPTVQHSPAIEFLMATACVS